MVTFPSFNLYCCYTRCCSNSLWFLDLESFRKSWKIKEWFENGLLSPVWYTAQHFFSLDEITRYLNWNDTNEVSGKRSMKSKLFAKKHLGFHCYSHNSKTQMLAVQNVFPILLCWFCGSRIRYSCTANIYDNVRHSITQII